MRKQKKYFFILGFLPILLFGCQQMAMNSTTDVKGNPEKLNLSRQHLTAIPEEVYEMVDLKVLKLYQNNIDSISPKIGQLKNLEKLYLGKNNLKHLPQEIKELKNLKILSIAYNKIEELPSSIGEMTNLEQLWANQNQLTELPKEMGKLENLKNLKLQFNLIDTLYEEVFDARGLEFIYLQQNRLNFLPESISELSKLKELYMNNAGFLLALPEAMCNLRNMEVLVIDRTTVVPTCLLTQQTTRLQISVR